MSSLESSNPKSDSASPKPKLLMLNNGNLLTSSKKSDEEKKRQSNNDNNSNKILDDEIIKIESDSSSNSNMNQSKNKKYLNDSSDFVNIIDTEQSESNKLDNLKNFSDDNDFKKSDDYPNSQHSKEEDEPKILSENDESSDIEIEEENKSMEKKEEEEKTEIKKEEKVETKIEEEEEEKYETKYEEEEEVKDESQSTENQVSTPNSNEKSEEEKKNSDVINKSDKADIIISYKSRSRLFNRQNRQEEGNNQRVPIRSYEDDKRSDDLISTLRRNYELCRQDRNELQMKLNAYQVLFDSLKIENQSLKDQIQELQNNQIEKTDEINPLTRKSSNPFLSLSDSDNSSKSSSNPKKSKSMIQHIQDANEEARRQNVVFSPRNQAKLNLKKSYQSNSNQLYAFNFQPHQPPIMMVPMVQFNPFLQQPNETPPTSTAKSYPKENLAFVQPQEKNPLSIGNKSVHFEYAEDPVRISISKHSVRFEIKKTVQPLDLTFVSQVDGVILPQPKEMEIFNAKRNAIQNEIIELHKKMAEDQKKYDDAITLVKQRDETVEKMKETISTLNKQLYDQRELFQERLRDYKNEAEAYVETIMNEKLGISNQTEEANSIPDKIKELSEVSQRLNELELKNSKLQNEFEESNETVRLLMRQNKVLKQKIEELTNENREIRERNSYNEKSQSLNKYATKLKQKNNELQQQFNDLQNEYNELKRTKSSRFDPLLMSRVIDKAIAERTGASNGPGDAVTDKQIITRMKNAEFLAENLKIRNNEMQILLEKSNNTIDRLNQLLTRKETQLTEFHKQIADLRQQIIILRGEKDS